MRNRPVRNELNRGEKKMSDEKEDEEVCIACGDGADSADELQAIIEEKAEEDDN